MSVTKELLQMDLYALLGIEEKAADKEVRMVARSTGPERSGALPVLAPRLAGTRFPGSTGPWASSDGLRRWDPSTILGWSESLTRKKGSQKEGSLCGVLCSPSSPCLVEAAARA